MIDLKSAYQRDIENLMLPDGGIKAVDLVKALENDKASENLLLLDLLIAHREEMSELRRIRAAKTKRLAGVALLMVYVTLAMSIALLIRIVF